MKTLKRYGCYLLINTVLFHSTHLYCATKSDNLLKSLVEKWKSQYRCPICMETTKSAKISPEGHIYCGKCIDKWLNIRQLSPITNQRLHKSDLFKLRLISQNEDGLRQLESNIRISKISTTQLDL